MPTFNCPSCGAPVPFHSDLSVSAVCAYCRTLVVRRDVDVEAIGKVAMLPPDMSPFRIGTQAWDGQTRVTLIGKVRMQWSDGFWNEWFFAGDDGRKGWLAEAQGTYALSYESTARLAPETQALIDGLRSPDKRLARPKTGDILTFEGHRFMLTDAKSARCIGADGELPMIRPTDTETMSYDFQGAPDQFASLELGGDEPRIFVGRYVEWDDLRAAQLSTIEGWS